MPTYIVIYVIKWEQWTMLIVGNVEDTEGEWGCKMCETYLVVLTSTYTSGNVKVFMLIFTYSVILF